MIKIWLIRWKLCWFNRIESVVVKTNLIPTLKQTCYFQQLGILISEINKIRFQQCLREKLWQNLYFTQHSWLKAIFL
jgi:hypothetical protein